MFVHFKHSASFAKGLFFVSLQSEVSARLLLLDRLNDVLEAHVRTQGFRNAHGAVGIQVVLQERDQHARRRDAGVVEGMGKVLAAVVTLDADAEAAGLRIAQRGAGANLKVLLLARAVGMYGGASIGRKDVQISCEPERQGGIGLLREKAV